MNNKLLVLDIGGTAIKYATYDSKLSEVKRLPTPSESVEAFMEQIDKIYSENPGCNGITLSMPGFIDDETGMNYQGGALVYIKDTNIKKLFEERYHLPVSVENDSKCATLAEMKYGCLKGINNAVTLLFGTGVGGTVLVDSKILRGTHLLAGEFSFVGTNIDHKIWHKYDCAGVLGKAGLSKSVEKCSGLADLNGFEIFQLIKEGNDAVLDGLKLFVKHVVWLIYSLQFITDPEVFAIGGGISEQDLFIDLINEELEKWKEELTFCPIRPEIRTCRYKSKANLIGAVIHFENEYGQN